MSEANFIGAKNELLSLYNTAWFEGMHNQSCTTFILNVNTYVRPIFYETII